MKKESKFKHTETPMKIVSKPKSSKLRTKKHMHLIGVENEEEVSTVTESFEKSPSKKIKRVKEAEDKNTEISSTPSSEILSKITTEDKNELNNKEDKNELNNKEIKEVNNKEINELNKEEIKEVIKNKGEIKEEKDKENLSNNDIKETEEILEEENLQETIQSLIFKWCKKNIIFLITILSILTPIYISNIENKKMIASLIKENEVFRIKLENKLNLSNIKPKESISLKNYCDVTFGTKINYSKTSPVYNYGLLWKWGYSKSPEILLDPYKRFEKYECVSFNTSNGQVCIDFLNTISLKRFIISYPYNQQTSSALKDFQLITIEDGKERIIYKSKYKNLEGSEYFEISNEKINNLILRWTSNYGKKYTTLYKIYIVAN